MENIPMEAKLFLDCSRNPGLTQCQICGTILRKSNRARHVRTEKHKLSKYVWTDRFEITRFTR